eukprot:2678959-Prymnesium_polylepis.1
MWTSNSACAGRNGSMDALVTSTTAVALTLYCAQGKLLRPDCARPRMAKMASVKETTWMTPWNLRAATRLLSHGPNELMAAKHQSSASPQTAMTARVTALFPRRTAGQDADFDDPSRRGV